MFVLLTLLLLLAVLYHNKLGVRVEIPLAALAIHIGYCLYVCKKEGFDETVNVDFNTASEPPRFRPNMAMSLVKVITGTGFSFMTALTFNNVSRVKGPIIIFGLIRFFKYLIFSKSISFPVS